jgi:hypothetical protein
MNSSKSKEAERQAKSKLGMIRMDILCEIRSVMSEMRQLAEALEYVAEEDETPEFAQTAQRLLTLRDELDAMLSLRMKPSIGAKQ